MFGAICGAVPLIIFYVITGGLATIYAFYSILYRKKFITVHEFENSDVEFSEWIRKVSQERVIQFARSMTYSNKFYLTNNRIIFSYNSLLKGKTLCKYFPVKSVANVGIEYKNPYIFLAVAGIGVIVGILLSVIGIASSEKSYYSTQNDSSSATLFIFLFLILAGIWVLLWFYVKGYYLIFDNGRIFGLFCRSKDGLINILKKFDILRFRNESELPHELPKQESKQIIRNKDVTCQDCKSVITLEEEDLKSDKFTCPVCGKDNII
jgi:hypothetical protein